MRGDIHQITRLITTPIWKPESFLEIGSRDGHDTFVVSKYWNIPDEKCFIFEPHPDCYNNIKKLYPKFNTFNVAISNKTEVVTFNAGIVGEEVNVGISSVLDRKNESDVFHSNKVEVDAWRIDDIMNHFKLEKFDLVKIDVEGLGYEVLEGFGEYIKKTKFIQIELETKEVWKGQRLLGDIVEFMKEKGFSLIDNIVLCDAQNDVLFMNNNI